MACINLHPLDDFVPRCVGAQWRTSIPNATSGGSNEKGPEFPRAISGLHRGGRCLVRVSIIQGDPRMIRSPHTDSDFFDPRNPAPPSAFPLLLKTSGLSTER